MALTTKYFTNVSNFEEIAEFLRTSDALPDQINKSYLEQLGYTDPADGLILNFFKDLKFLEDDNTPTPLLENFRDPSTSKEALAVGILEAYGDLFEENPKVYQQSKVKIVKLLESLLEEEKSNIIINYMAKTFSVMVDYVGSETIEAVLKRREYYDSFLDNSEEQKGSGEENESQLVTDKLESPNSNNHSNTSELEPSNKAKNGIDKRIQESASENLESVQSFAPEVDEIEDESKEKVTAYINKAYIKKAELLYKLKRYEEALPSLDKVYQKFADAKDEELYDSASVALVKKMKTAEKLELKDYLFSIYPVVIERLASTKNSELAAAVDHAYINLTEILVESDQVEKALDVIDQAIHRFKGRKQYSDFLAKLMFTRAELLEQSEDNEKALEAFDNFLKIFG